jgi:hypothetical protein
MTRAEEKKLKKKWYNKCRKLKDEIIHVRDKNKCQRFGLCLSKNITRLNVSHIIPVGRAKHMEMDTDNVVLLCYQCHSQWWHLNPIAAWEWIKEYLGESKYEDLKRREQQSPLVNLAFYESRYSYLQDEYLKQKGE